MPVYAFHSLTTMVYSLFYIFQLIPVLFIIKPLQFLPGLLQRQSGTFISGMELKHPVNIALLLCNLPALRVNKLKGKRNMPDKVFCRRIHNLTLDRVMLPDMFHHCISHP